MPTERTRSKDDTWTTDELSKALKGERRKHKGNDDEKHRRRDDEDGRSERRKHRDDMNGDSEHRKKKSDESDRRRRHRDEVDGQSALTEEERDRLRRERREKREKDSGSTTRKKEDKKSRDDKAEEETESRERRRHHRDEDPDKKEKRRHDDEGKKHRSGQDDDERRRHRDGDEDRRKSKHRDDEDHKKRRDDDDRRRDRDDDDRRKHRDESDRKKRDDGDRRRHRDDDERKRNRDDDDDRRRRKDDDEKKRHRDDDDKRRRHKDDDEKRRHRDDDDKRRRHRDEDEDDKERQKRREERREERDKRKGKSEEDERRKKREDRHKDEEQDNDMVRSQRVLTRQRRVESPDEFFVDLEKEEHERRHQERRERREKKEDKDKKSKSEDRGEKKVDKYDEIDEPPKHPESTAGEDEAEPDYEEDFEDYEDDFEEYKPDAVLGNPEAERPSRMGYFVNIDEGEVEEVLRALDEENNRLLSASHRSNWSDSTDLSDERFHSPRRNRDADREEAPVRKPRPVGGIFNFVSAKQRVMSQKLMGKTQKRATDLAKIIELDVAKYDMFDLPPVKEYDLYIRNFGSANTKQAYVQTNEDNIEREIQTEEIDSHVKWTQYPAEDLKDCGGDGIDSATTAQSSETSIGDSSRLPQFLGRTGQIIGILMEEEKKDYDTDAVAGQKANVSWSSGFFELGLPRILSGRMVTEASFCPGQPNMLLTIHYAPTQNAEEVVSQGSNFSRRGLVCVWNVNDPSIPHRVLACEALPSCCCFSPSQASLAFAGMSDGSVVAWDLREPNFMHHKVEVEGEGVVVRYPTYNTARVLEEENHLSPVTAIMPVHSISTSSRGGAGDSSDTSGLSFQLATLEENGVINLWVVAEIPVPDTAGSQVDLGLAPGGRIKLVKSSKITLDSPAKDISLRSSLHTFDIQLKPDDLNHYYVGTDMGHIIHGVRFGSRPFPRSHVPANGAPLQIVSIDFSPFGCPYFLAGCDDGSVLLFHTQLEKAIFSWPPASPGRSVQCVRWSTSRPAVFFVLDSSSTVIVFDLVEAEMLAVKNDRIKSGKVISIALTPDLRTADVGSNPHPPQLFLSLENGTTEIHTISKQYTEPQPLELEFLQNYVDRF